MMSTGIERCTGPGYPEVAMRYARSTNSEIRVPSRTAALYLVKGAAMATSSISLKPPLPSRWKVEEPVMKMTGERSPQASIMAGTALAKPSGPIRQAVGLRVMRVRPSARWPAICSWGALTTGIWHSISPSSAGMQKPPLSVKTWSMPFSKSAWASTVPPRIFMFVPRFGRSGCHRCPSDPAFPTGRWKR